MFGGRAATKFRFVTENGSRRYRGNRRWRAGGRRPNWQCPSKKIAGPFNPNPESALVQHVSDRMPRPSPCLDFSSPLQGPTVQPRGVPIFSPNPPVILLHLLQKSPRCPRTVRGRWTNGCTEGDTGAPAAVSAIRHRTSSSNNRARCYDSQAITKKKKNTNPYPDTGLSSLSQPDHQRSSAGRKHIFSTTSHARTIRNAETHESERTIARTIDRLPTDPRRTGELAHRITPGNQGITTLGIPHQQSNNHELLLRHHRHPRQPALRV